MRCRQDATACSMPTQSRCRVRSPRCWRRACQGRASGVPEATSPTARPRPQRDIRSMLTALLLARVAGVEKLSVRRPRLRIVNVPGATVTTQMIADIARAAGLDVSALEAGARDAASIAEALDVSACDLAADDRRQRRRSPGCRGDGAGSARGRARPWPCAPARTHRRGRAARKGSRRCLARLARSGARGLVRVGAVRSSTDCRRGSRAGR